MSILEDLIAVRDRLTSKKNWTQGSWARSRTIHKKINSPHPFAFYVLPTDPETDQWCLVGAVAAVAEDIPFQWSERSWEMFTLLANDERAFCDADAMNFLIRWNDWPGRSHNEVLRRIDEAIAKHRALEERIVFLEDRVLKEERVLEDA
jgi:hypothetical protein